MISKKKKQISLNKVKIKVFENFSIEVEKFVESCFLIQSKMIVVASIEEDKSEVNESSVNLPEVAVNVVGSELGCSLGVNLREASPLRLAENLVGVNLRMASHLK